MIKMYGGWTFIFFLLLCIFGLKYKIYTVSVASIGSVIISNNYGQELTELGNKKYADNHEIYETVFYYCLFKILTKIVMVFVYCLIYFMGVVDSKKIHKNIVDKLIKASFPKFYNVVMTGRLMNRLSKDIYNVDRYLPETLLQGFGQFLDIISFTISFILISI